MSNAIHLHYEVSGEDFTRAGEASGAVKKRLKSLGYNPDAIRRVAIAMYEAEINAFIHGGGGEATVDIDNETHTDNGALCYGCLSYTDGSSVC